MDSNWISINLSNLILLLANVTSKGTFCFTEVHEFYTIFPGIRSSGGIANEIRLDMCKTLPNCHFGQQMTHLLIFLSNCLRLDLLMGCHWAACWASLEPHLRLGRPATSCKNKYKSCNRDCRPKHFSVSLWESGDLVREVGDLLIN